MNQTWWQTSSGTDSGEGTGTGRVLSTTPDPENIPNGDHENKTLMGNRFLNMKAYIKNRTQEKTAGNNFRRLQFDDEEEETADDVKIVKGIIWSA